MPWEKLCKEAHHCDLPVNKQLKKVGAGSVWKCVCGARYELISVRIYLNDSWMGRGYKADWKKLDDQLAFEF